MSCNVRRHRSTTLVPVAPGAVPLQCRQVTRSATPIASQSPAECGERPVYNLGIRAATSTCVLPSTFECGRIPANEGQHAVEPCEGPPELGFPLALFEPVHHANCSRAARQRLPGIDRTKRSSEHGQTVLYSSSWIRLELRPFMDRAQGGIPRPSFGPGPGVAAE